MRRIAADWTRWRLVDSSGSRKPAARPMRDAIAVPRLAPLASREAQLVRIGQLLAVEVGEQQLLGGFVVDVAAANRRSPLPVRCCSRMRHCQPASRAVDRVQRRSTAPSARRARPWPGRTAASASNPRSPVFERLPDQQRAEARAVDEEIGLERAAVLQRHRTRCRHCRACRRRRSCLRCAGRRAARRRPRR